MSTQVIQAKRLLNFQITEEEAAIARNKLLEYLRFVGKKTEKTTEEVEAETAISSFIDKIHQQLPSGIGPTYRETITKLNELNAARSQLEFSRAYGWFLYNGIHIVQASEPKRWILLEGMV